MTGFWCLGIVGVLIFLVRWIADLRYKRGYLKGRSDAEAWIVQLETDVDQARQEIWKEER